MDIVAIMGSPRKGGNSDLLLDAFLGGAGEDGTAYEKISVCDPGISPCTECLACERTGECNIDDGMQTVYPKLLAAGKIVISAPIYFYGLPAQFKALIDRCQALWARKYILNSAPAALSSVEGLSKPDSKLPESGLETPPTDNLLRLRNSNSADHVSEKLSDHGQPPKEAFALLLGATGGRELFAGSLLTIKYFLEPLNVRLTGSLLFRKISRKGDILRHPTALSDAYQAGRVFTSKTQRH
ncbi:MAG: flavodoxin family protein [PVC group bacterium]